MVHEADLRTPNHLVCSCTIALQVLYLFCKSSVHQHNPYITLFIYPTRMATPASGFSFEDFVSATKLINDIRKALSDTSGAAEEVRSLCQDLEQLEALLTHLSNDEWGKGGRFGARRRYWRCRAGLLSAAERLLSTN